MKTRICCALICAFAVSCGDEFPVTPCPDGTEQDLDTGLCIKTVTVVRYQDPKIVEVPVDEPFPCPGQLADEQGNCSDASVAPVPPVLEVSFTSAFHAAVPFPVTPGQENVHFGTFLFTVIGDGPVRVPNFRPFILAADDPNDLYTVNGDLPVSSNMHVTFCRLVTWPALNTIGGGSAPNDQDGRLAYGDFWVDEGFSTAIDVTCNITTAPPNGETDGFMADIDTDSLPGVTDADDNPVEVRITATNGNPPQVAAILNNPPTNLCQFTAGAAGGEERSVPTRPIFRVADGSPSGAGIPGFNEVFRFSISAPDCGGVLIDHLYFGLLTTDNADTEWIYDLALNFNSRLDMYNILDPVVEVGNVDDASFTDYTTDGADDQINWGVRFDEYIRIQTGATETFSVEVDTLGASSALDDHVFIALWNASWRLMDDPNVIYYSRVDNVEYELPLYGGAIVY